MDRDGLADFLTRRRAALQPGDVGLDPGRRRRTAGLRREEVAALAHMSTDFYTRLEQRRGSRPSAQTVAALARALRLTQDERDHLFHLAGHAPPTRGARSDHVSPALMRVLDRLDTPAHVSSDLGVVLEQNALGVALLGRKTGFTGPRRSLMYRWFVEPQERARYAEEEHERTSRSYVAHLRAVHGRDAGDAEIRDLVDRLRRESPEFAALWEEHEVALRTDTHKTIVHPTIGPITLDCQILTSESQHELLVVFTASPGSPDAQRLELLGVVGTQEFTPL